MKLLMSIAALAVLTLATAACDGEKSDPATEDRSDLNPPTGLATLTGDGQVTLRWQGNNTEDDFKGYHVFAFKGKLDTAGAATYPKALTSADLGTASIPRCAGNTALFESFGFPASESDCEGDTTADDGPAAAEGASLQEEGEEAPEEESDGEEPLAAIVKCDGAGSAEISLPASGNVLGPQECVVTALSDGTALANGETYSFFVAAVLGDDLDKISWTSNFVEDTPANSIFKGEISIASGKGIFLPVAKLQEKVGAISLAASSTLDDHIHARDELVAADFEEKACAGDFCNITTPNNGQAADGLYFGRFGGTKPTRIFFSTPASKAITYSYRGPQTYDPQSEDAISDTIPGDMAADREGGSYIADGAFTTVYENQVIDLWIANGEGSGNYAKVVIGARSIDGADATTDPIKLPITILVQENIDNRHYLK